MNNNYPLINKPLLEQILVFHRGQLQRFEQMAGEVSCGTCEHFAPGPLAANKCTKFDANPPPEVQSVGCAEWVHDPIPF